MGDNFEDDYPEEKMNLMKESPNFGREEPSSVTKKRNSILNVAGFDFYNNHTSNSPVNNSLSFNNNFSNLSKNNGRGSIISQSRSTSPQAAAAAISAVTFSSQVNE